MNIVFIIVLLILVFSAINGWRKGLLGMIYGLISWVCILVFVIWASPYIDGYIRERTSIPETMGQKVERSVSEKMEEISQNAKEGQEKIWNELAEELPEPLRKAIEEVLPQADNAVQEGSAQESAVQENAASAENTAAQENESPAESAAGQENVQGAQAEQGGEAAQTISQAISQKLLDFMIRGIAVLIAFIVAQLVVWFVGNIISAVGDAPIVSGINGFLGFAAGAVQGFLYVWILMYLVSLTSASGFSQQIIAYIHQNSFTEYLYQHNIILAIIEMF